VRITDFKIWRDRSYASLILQQQRKLPGVGTLTFDLTKKGANSEAAGAIAFSPVQCVELDTEP